MEENKPSIFRKHDLGNIIKVTLGVFLFMSFAWMTGGLLSFSSLFAALVIGLSISLLLYVPILISRKIVSENNTIGRALFVSFVAILLIILALFIVFQVYNVK